MAGDRRATLVVAGGPSTYAGNFHPPLGGTNKQSAAARPPHIALAWTNGAGAFCPTRDNSPFAEAQSWGFGGVPPNRDRSEALRADPPFRKRGDPCSGRSSGMVNVQTVGQTAHVHRPTAWERWLLTRQLAAAERQAEAGDVISDPAIAQ